MAEERWQEIRKIQRDYRPFYVLLGAVVLVTLITVALREIANNDENFDLNLATEIVGILITVGVIEWFNQRRDENRLKRQLVMDAGSLSNEKALDAIHQLRRNGWLEGDNGLLKGADLNDANLQGVNLAGANMQQVTLWSANLQNAALWSANLQNATLIGANLHNGALWGANLQGTDLGYVNLEGVGLADAQFDEATILPDGSHWTPDTDLTRFTDPAHLQFWKPDWVTD